MNIFERHEIRAKEISIQFQTLQVHLKLYIVTTFKYHGHFVGRISGPKLPRFTLCKVGLMKKLRLCQK